MVEIIHENEDWLGFFETALKEINVEYRRNHIELFELDLNQPPDNILYLNRISPSSHTRGNRSAVIKGEQYLEYLAAYKRRVINDNRTVNYEMSKVEQYRLLRRFGLAHPTTTFSSEIDELVRAAATMPLPLITKHNRSGKGLGIKRFDDIRSLEEYLRSDQYIPSPDGILLLQQYIRPKNDRITRVEIIDGELVYAYHISTEHEPNPYPAGAPGADGEAEFSLSPESNELPYTYIPDFDHPLVPKYIELSKAAGFDMVGLEFIEGVNGAIYTYDINGTTNYPPDVEKQSGHKARRAFQQFIGRLLRS